MNELALFAGAGGGILAGSMLGWRTVCAVENDTYAASVLVARQNDGSLGPFPIWDDVCTFDGRPWRGAIDVVSGGFPCQDISASGKRTGIVGARSSLWKEMARIVSEVQPQYVFVENSPLLVRSGLALVLGDLATLGYDAAWGVLGAYHVGAPHKRERIWIAAQHRGELTCDRPGDVLAYADTQRAQVPPHGQHATEQMSECARWWQTQPSVDRVADGVARRLDRLKCLGNGQVPSVAATAWRLLTERLQLSV